MNRDPSQKYRPFAPIVLPDRTWPNQVITRPPVWCSVDLRDGNQALIEPMDAERKLRMFMLLLKTGFKEIEIGFPAASQTDFDFVRKLIEEKLIPDDVTVQVLTQAREPLIRRTFESLRGAKRAIMHLYNSTSTVQRRVVFGLDKPGIVDIAVDGARVVLDCAKQQPQTDWVFQYSPESFTGTELDFAVEICDAVNAVWRPTPKRTGHPQPAATVEMATPNVYADQIEWFGRHLADRDSIVLSVHPHNDRGCAVAAAELAVMAGADRIEGCLFGNGERTGNVDLVNAGPQSLHPGRRSRTRFLRHQRRDPHGRALQPAAGAPAPSLRRRTGVHGFFRFAPGRDQERPRRAQGDRSLGSALPADRPGRSRPQLRRGHPRQQPVGQGRHCLSAGTRFRLVAAAPAADRIQPGDSGHHGCDRQGDKEFLESERPLAYIEHRITHDAGHGEVENVTARLKFNGREIAIAGKGNGPVDAFVRALCEGCGIDVHVMNYHEHAVGSGEDATAVAYVQIRIGRDQTLYGAGMHGNIVTATLRAVLSAVNRAALKGLITVREPAQRIAAA
jgi:2-isopropylmalate synthase